MPAQLRRLVTQPHGLARIDWSDPLNQGLRFVFDMARGPREFLTGETPRTSSDTLQSVVESSDQWRAAYLSAAIQENLQWGNNATATSSALNGILSGASQSTVELLFRTRSTGTTPHLFGQWNLSSGNHWLVQINGTGLVWIAAEDAGSNRTRFDGTSLFTANVWHRLILSWRGGSNFTAILDRTERSLSTVSAAASTIRANPVALRIAPNTGGTPNADVALARIWNRGLSRDECLQLAERMPFEFYARKRVYVPLAGPPPAVVDITPGETSVSFTYSGPATHYRVFRIGDTPGPWISIPSSPVFVGSLITNDEYTIQLSGDGSTVADAENFGTTNPGTGGGSFDLSGGGSAFVSVTAAGAGTAAVSSSGGGSAVVLVIAAGAGDAAVTGSGGGSALVSVTAAGAGTAAEASSGGGSALVNVTASGAGTAATATSGGGSAFVNVTAVGAGTASSATESGGSAVVAVLARGDGIGSIAFSSGGQVLVRVTARGAGTSVAPEDTAYPLAGLSQPYPLAGLTQT